MTWHKRSRLKFKIFVAALHSLNRANELRRLMAWARRKRLEGPLDLYTSRMVEEETKLMKLSLRFPNEMRLARACTRDQQSHQSKTALYAKRLCQRISLQITLKNQHIYPNGYERSICPMKIVSWTRAMLWQPPGSLQPLTWIPSRTIQS